MHLRSDSGFSVGWALAALAAAAVGMGLALILAQSPRGLSQFERLGAEIGCQCGTCPLRPIATCGCSFADGMLDELHQFVDAGHTDAEVMTTFVARYDVSVRIKPAASGADLIAWAAPMLLLTLGAVTLAAVVTRWAAAGVEASESRTQQLDVGPEARVADDELRARLERELGELDD